MDEELTKCDNLELKNVHAHRRNEEIKVEIHEVLNKIEEIRRENQLLEFEMDATVQETEALLKQKEANSLCLELEHEAMQLAKEKLARLTVTNSKMKQENSNSVLEWREHLETGEKIMSHIRGLYSSAPWIVDDDSSKKSIESAKLETSKQWDLIKVSFQSSGDDGGTDEDGFMQQMTIIRRLANKIVRNNREWLKQFPPKAKRTSAAHLLNAEALLNDSLAELDEDEGKEDDNAPRFFSDENQEPVQHVKFASPIEKAAEQQPEIIIVTESNEQENRSEGSGSSGDQMSPSVKRKATDFGTPDTPKKPKHCEASIKPVQHVTFASPIEKAAEQEPEIVIVTESNEQKTRSEGSSSSGDQMIFDCTIDESENRRVEPEPSFLAGLGGGDKDANASQDNFGFNFAGEGNDTQGENGFFNMFTANTDDADTASNDNNGFNFNFGEGVDNDEGNVEGMFNLY